MPDHYYSATPTSAHDVRTVSLACGNRTLTCQTDAGVFSREHLDPGSALLLSALPMDLRGRVLDLGCGWGPVGLCLAATRPDARIVCCDVNQRAVELAAANFAANGLAADCVVSDGLSDVSGDFSLIATNPPIRAGKAVIFRLFAESRQRLTPGGALYAVIRKQQGAPSALSYLKTLFFTAEVVKKSAGYWVIACQVAHPISPSSKEERT